MTASPLPPSRPDSWLDRIPRPVWLLALLGLWLLGLGAAPLIDVDEGAFSEASREMIVSHDWGHTTLQGADRFDKPIGIYWLQAACMELLGKRELAVRLPSALAAWLWCLAAMRFAQRLPDGGQGTRAGLVVASSLGVMLIGRAATADALLNALMAWTCLEAWRFLADGDRRAWRRAHLWMGLGLLTKGPVAMLVPGGAVLVYLLLNRQWGRLRHLFDDGWAWLILLGSAAPWYLYALHRHGMAFVDGFLLQHNVNRFLHAKEGHGGGAWYPLLMIPLLLLPWSPLLVGVLARLKAELLPKPGPSLTAAEPPSTTQFLWCWALFALGFFSLSNTKLPHYLLYGLTPVMVLQASALARPLSKRVLVALALTQALLWLALGSTHRLALVLAAHTADPVYHALLSSAPAAPAWPWLATALAGWGLLWCWPRRQPGGERALLAGLWVSAWCVGLLLPWWATTLQGPVRELALRAQVIGQGRVGVTQWGTRQPSFAFYLGAKTPAGEPAAGEMALVKLETLRAQDSKHWRILAQAADFALVQAAASQP